PAGVPTTLLLKCVPNTSTGESSCSASPASKLLDIWASLEFMHELFGEASPLPRLYAGDRQALWLVIEDFSVNDPLQQALWGSDPVSATHELVRLMTMLGEMQARALPRTARFLAMRHALGGYIDFLDPAHGPAPILAYWVQALTELGFGLPP